MNRRVALVAGLAGLVLLTACSSGGTIGGTAQSGVHSVVSSVPPPPTETVDPNTEACAKVSEYMVGKVKPTFDSWDLDANEFNKRVARALRTEATHLYALARNATGSTSDAIRAEAKGLTDISIGIEVEDDSALADASTAANSALADLRGTCDF
jgi:hypothetical protein